MLCFSTVMALAPSLGQAESACGVPERNPHGWNVEAQASSGFDPATLCEMASYFESKTDENVHSVLIARNGKLVFEKYFDGQDEKFNDRIGHVTFGRDVLHDLRSMTKSVVSLTFGVGLREKWVNDVNDPIHDYLPALKDRRDQTHGAITFKNALLMSSGILANDTKSPYADPKNTSFLLDAATDQCQFVQSLPVDDTPGATYNYTNINPTLVGCALFAKTGKQIDQLVLENLFKPLEISKFEWKRISKTGQLAQGWGLRMLPLDTLKLGQLVLAKGQWKGKEVVPKEWIAEATKPQVKVDDKYSYGYFFWTSSTSSAGRKVEYAVMRGTGGQYVYIVPSLDLVALLHAGRYKAKREDAARPVEMAFEKFILPSIKN